MHPITSQLTQLATKPKSHWIDWFLIFKNSNPDPIPTLIESYLVEGIHQKVILGIFKHHLSSKQSIKTEYWWILADSIQPNSNWIDLLHWYQMLQYCSIQEPTFWSLICENTVISNLNHSNTFVYAWALFVLGKSSLYCSEYHAFCIDQIVIAEQTQKASVLSVVRKLTRLKKL